MCTCSESFLYVTLIDSLIVDFMIKELHIQSCKLWSSWCIKLCGSEWFRFRALLLNCSHVGPFSWALGMVHQSYILAEDNYMLYGYKITGLMLEHLLFKQLHNRNVVTLNVLPSAIPTPLHANFPLLEAMLQVIFWWLVHEFRRFCLHCIYGLKPGSF